MDSLEADDPFRPSKALVEKLIESSPTLWIALKIESEKIPSATTLTALADFLKQHADYAQPASDRQTMRRNLVVRDILGAARLERLREAPQSGWKIAERKATHVLMDLIEEVPGLWRLLKWVEKKGSAMGEAGDASHSWLVHDKSVLGSDNSGGLSLPNDMMMAFRTFAAQSVIGFDAEVRDLAPFQKPT